MWNSLEIPKEIRDESILLEEIIMRVSERERKQVVVLVDEYDKPILDVIENIKEAQEVRKELKAFYSVLKGLD
jgi:hypothetical protein